MSTDCGVYCIQLRQKCILDVIVQIEHINGEIRHSGLARCGLYLLSETTWNDVFNWCFYFR